MQARTGVQRVAAGVALLGLASGCAQIVSRSTVEVVPRHDAAALVVGPPGGEITGREARAQWTQDGDRLTVRLEESRTCHSVRHVPVVRIERLDRRTARGAMWFEYGFGAAAMATGLVGLIRPEWFSQASVVNEEGQVLEDKRTGYRIGGILTGVGSLLLIAAVIDTVRTRDEVRYADAYRREEGGMVQCMDPLAPMEGQTVELLVGKWSSVEGTDDGGGARFLLPGVEDLPEDARKVIEATAAWDAAKREAEEAERKAAEEAAAKAAAEAEAAAKKGRKGKASAGKRGAGLGTVGEHPKVGSGNPPPMVGLKAESGEAGATAATELGPRPEPVVVKGVLRLDNKRALAVSFLVPYDAEQAKGFEGEGVVDPGPSGGRAPGTGKALSLGGARAAESGATTSEGDGGGDGKAEAGEGAGTARPSGEADASEGAGSARPSGETDASEGAGSARPSGETSNDATSNGATKPSAGSGTSKPGAPTLKLGGSGTSKPGTGSGTTGKKGEASLTLGGGGARKSGTTDASHSASETGEAP